MGKTNRSDIAVIIPSYYPGKTIKHVIETVDRGLRRYFPKKNGLIIIIDSSDKKTQKDIRKYCQRVSTKTIIKFHKKRVTKGEAIFAGLEIALGDRPDVVVMFDSDLKSIEPDWVKKFALPIMKKEAAFIGPNYVRDKYDSLITNHIVYPLVRSFFGADLRQPIGGDFAFSGDLAGFYMNKECFSSEVEKYGIDVWLSITAIVNNYKVGQVSLGVKDHGVTIKNPKLPEKSLGIMFREVVTTLFSLLAHYQKKWKGGPSSEVINFYKPIIATPKPVIADFANLWGAFKRLYPKHRSLCQKVLSASNFKKIDAAFSMKKPNVSISALDWSDFIFDYFKKFAVTRGKNKKLKLVNSLVAVYFARIACFVEETKDLTNSEVEKKIQAGIEAFRKRVDQMATRA